MKKVVKFKADRTSRLSSETGKIGYVIAWMLGVPATLLFFVYLIRG